MDDDKKAGGDPVELLTVTLFPGMTVALSHLAAKERVPVDKYIRDLLVVHIEARLDIKAPKDRPIM